MFQSGNDLFLREFPLVEVFFEQAVLALGYLFHELLAIALGVLLHVIRNLFFFDLAAAVLGKIEGFHFDKIDDTGEGCLDTDGELEHQGSLAEIFFHITHGAQKIRAFLVELAHEGDPRGLVITGIPVYFFRLCFYTGNCRNNNHGAVHGLERTLCFFEKINIPRRVDDIHAGAFPVEESEG